MIRFCMLLKAMSGVSFSLLLTLPPVFFQLLISMRRGSVLSPLAHLPHTPRCLLDAIQEPREVGDGGRLLGNFQLPNSVIDMRRSASSLATLTGLASVPA